MKNTYYAGQLLFCVYVFVLVYLFEIICKLFKSHVEEMLF